jgi:hypothetical protein
MLIETQIAHALKAVGVNYASRAIIARFNLLAEHSTDKIIIRPVISRGGGQWTSYTDNTFGFALILKAIHCSYEQGNDAPKGGKLGNWISFNRNEFEACLKSKTGYDLRAVRNGVIL